MKTYKNVEDIDFYIGMLAEFTESKEGIVGTTLRCILADQFVRLKRGDRFYYENPGQPSTFTPGKIIGASKIDHPPKICKFRRQGVKVKRKKT